MDRVQELLKKQARKIRRKLGIKKKVFKNKNELIDALYSASGLSHCDICNELVNDNTPCYTCGHAGFFKEDIQLLEDKEQ